MDLSEYSELDAVGLAEAIRSGRLHGRDVVETALHAADLVHRRLNVIAHDLSVRAWQQVSDINLDAPFAGVPFLVKDLSMEIAGAPNEAGSRLLAGNVAERSHSLMDRFDAVGLITLGRTTTAEFGAQLSTESLRTGVTGNPWNPEYSAGGSSGGSCVAVATGVVPIAHANDGIGSIRIPAANCGLFGLKPTRQRTPSGPEAGETIGGRGSEFVVTRTVRDAAHLLDQVHGADTGAPCWAPPPARPYRAELSGDRRHLRIAVMTSTFSGAPVHAECADAVRQTAVACEELGHIVEEATPRFDWAAYRWAIRTEAFANFHAGLRHFSERTGRAVDHDTLEPLNLLAFAEGGQVSTADYLRSIAVYGRVQRELGSFFEEYDLLLTPVLTRPPARIGELAADPTDLDRYWDEFSGDAYSPFTGVWNVSGHPAASVPLGMSKEGLPLGTHVVGRFGDEGAILNLAAQLEQARPWLARRPALHATAL